MKRLHPLPIAAGLALAAAVAHGQESAPAPATPPADAPTDTPAETAQLTLEDLRTFTDVFNQIRLSFVEEVDDHTLLEAAINGMISELDPHSSYMTPNEYREMDDTARGRYSGVGVEVTTRDGRIVIVAATEGGPAASRDIRSGDVITAIDGVPVRGRRLQAAIAELRGEPGSTVELRIARDGADPRDVSLQRDYVRVPSVRSRVLEGDYGYLRLSQFHRESDADMRQALERLQAGRETPLRGLVLDLRNNPGGLVQPAVAIADGFLDDGLILETRGRDEGTRQSYTAGPGQWAPGVPMVVLVDGATASASEILAGALQDQKRALVVGTKTFGKGSVQSVLAMRNGGAIKLTTSRYYTPSGRSIQAEGIEPDVVVQPVELLDEPPRRWREADLEGHLAGDNAKREGRGEIETVDPEEDYTLYQALTLLKGSAVLSAGRNGPPAELHADASGADSPR